MRSVLVDTNVMLHAINNDGRLSRTARTVLADEGIELIASSISIYEVGVKHRIGKLDVPPRPFYAASLPLGIVFAVPTELTFITASELPWKHRDPWDRVVVATALQRTEGRVLTADTAMGEAPGVTRVW